MSHQVDVLLPGAYGLAEGPRWDAAAGELVWVDILEGHILRAPFDGKDLGPVSCLAVDGPVGFVALTDAGLVAGIGTDFCGIDPRGTVYPIARTGHEAPGPTRMNDGAADPAGRVFGGVLGLGLEPGWGALYRLDDSTCTKVIDGMTIPNGLGWSPDGATMYVTESISRSITAYEYDVRTGALGDPRPYVQTDPNAPGGPDGLDIDEDGRVWSTMWGLGCVMCFDPSGREVDRIDVPVRQPTACAFAGPDRNRLVITSARHGLADPKPLDGALFITNVGARGLPHAR